MTYDFKQAGSRGGKAAAAISPEERAERARNAALARWGGKTKEQRKLEAARGRATEIASLKKGKRK